MIPAQWNNISPDKLHFTLLELQAINGIWYKVPDYQGMFSYNFCCSGLAQPDPYAFFIPHALTLAEDRKLVCVADRENGRVLCFDWNNGTFVFHISSPQIGSLVYSVTYSPLQGIY